MKTRAVAGCCEQADEHLYSVKGSKLLGKIINYVFRSDYSA
jgi:hypothetical protein